MTKGNIINIVAEGTGLTQLETGAVVDGFLATIGYALQTGDTVTIRGFGSFRLRQREPRKGRNPKTGDKVDVPPKKVPYFKPGKELKELINREPVPPLTPPPSSDTGVPGY